MMNSETFRPKRRRRCYGGNAGKNSRLPFGKRELQLDINVDGQVLPLVAAKVLAARASIFQSLIESDGELEI